MAAMRDDFNPDEFYGGPSRSMQRRDALDILALAGALMELSPGALSRVPLSDALRSQVDFARSITAHIARKREMQFLAKHLRKAEDELPAIRDAVGDVKEIKRREAAAHHRLEQWRDRLSTGTDDDLIAAMAEFPGLPRQTVRQLMRQARTESDQGKPPAAARKLFRMLKDADEVGGQGNGPEEQDDD